MKRIAFVLGSAALAIGCADIFGLGDYMDAVDAGDGSTDDGTMMDGSPPDSGGPDVNDAEVGCGMTEVCNDGIDNDCNKLVDCEDPSCAAGWTCTPPLPNGWTYVAYDQPNRPGCASGFGTAVDVVEGMTAGTPSCSCGCGLNAPACAPMAVTAGDAGSNGCDNLAKQNENGNAGCQVLSAQIQTTSSKMSVTVNPTGGNCAPDAGVVKPPPAFSYSGRVCELTTPLGAGCGMNVCTPKPAPFVTCVRQAGMATCPNGFPVQHLVATTIADGRGCTACTCGYAAGSCKGTVTFWTAMNCGVTSQPVTADGTCQTVANGVWKAYQYVPQLTGAGCTPSGVSPVGDAGFADPATICCTN